MLTNNKQKLITALHQKKFRQEHGLFVIEGVKIISEFISRTDLVQELFMTENILFSDDVMLTIKKKNIEVSIVDEKTLVKLSALITPQNCIAIVKTNENKIDNLKLDEEKIIVLDDIQDPGNLGTIIRTADWFGIKSIVCSNNSVDCYNSKVVQASMGSICNTDIYYTNITSLLEKAKNQKVTIYGTLLEGENINEVEFAPTGILLLGNESKGISKSNLPFITNPITIKKSNTTFAESLNIAIAASICCSKWN